MSDEPDKVVAAREAVERYQQRMKAYLGGIFLFVATFVGAGVLDAPEPVVWTTLALYMAWIFGGLGWSGALKIKDHQEVLKAWEGRALQEEFDRFDRAVDVDDPRLSAARQVAAQVQGLSASDDETDAMVAALMDRLGRLVADHTTATAAVDALKAAGAGAAGTERLAATAAGMNDEIARILDGLSELYATLLEVEQGKAATTDALGAVRDWLAAEAEIARSAEDIEAMRPARGSIAGRGTEEA